MRPLKAFTFLLLVIFTLTNTTSLFAQSDRMIRVQSQIESTLKKNKSVLLNYDSTLNEVYQHLEWINYGPDKLSLLHTNRVSLQKAGILYPLYEMLVSTGYGPEVRSNGDCKDCEIARKILSYSANNNNAEANWVLGMIYQENSRFNRNFDYPPNKQKSIEYMAKAHELGHENAAFDLGSYLQLKKDYKQAINWFIKTKNSRSLALFFVSDIYRSGKPGVSKNQKRANEYLLAAVNEKNSNSKFARFKYASFLYFGVEGFSKNTTQAKKILSELSLENDYDAKQFIKKHNIKL